MNLLAHPDIGLLGAHVVAISHNSSLYSIDVGKDVHISLGFPVGAQAGAVQSAAGLKLLLTLTLHTSATTSCPLPQQASPLPAMWLQALPPLSHSRTP